jgi:hypothetical protein
MRRKTPEDFYREWELPARKFLAEYGMVLDFTIGALVLAAVSFCIGYVFGVRAR